MRRQDEGLGRAERAPLESVPEQSSPADLRGDAEFLRASGELRDIRGVTRSHDRQAQRRIARDDISEGVDELIASFLRMHAAEEQQHALVPKLGESCEERLAKLRRLGGRGSNTAA